jgi:hypothetical protein
MPVLPTNDLVETLKRAAEQARIVQERAAAARNAEPLTVPETNQVNTARPAPKG